MSQHHILKNGKQIESAPTKYVARQVAGLLNDRYSAEYSYEAADDAIKEEQARVAT